MDEHTKTEYTESETLDDTLSTREPVISTDSSSEVNKIPVVQQLTLLAVLMFLLFGGVLTPTIIGFFKEESQSIPAAPAYREIEQEQNKQSGPTPAIKPFTEVSIRGEAAYVWDIQNQRALYKKNEREQLPLASVTKLMTALIAYELLAEQDKIAINTASVAQYGNSGLLEGEVFDRLLLTDLVLMSSSNDGAYALAAAAGMTLNETNGANAFVHAMNIRAKELGLHDTNYQNPTGLDISPTESGALGSAKDMAFLMEHLALHEPDILQYTTQDQARIYSDNGIYHDAENTNYYIDQIPGLIGSKTGYTDLAGGNLVVAFNAGLNRPIVISVLGSTRHERFTDVMELVKETQQYVTQQ